MNDKDQYIDYKAVKLMDGTLLHVGDTFPACPESETLWTLDRIGYDYEVTRMLVLKFSLGENGTMTRHYPLSSVEFLGGCTK